MVLAAELVICLLLTPSQLCAGCFLCTGSSEPHNKLLTMVLLMVLLSPLTEEEPEAQSG